MHSRVTHFTFENFLLRSSRTKVSDVVSYIEYMNRETRKNRHGKHVEGLPSTKTCRDPFRDHKDLSPRCHTEKGQHCGDMGNIQSNRSTAQCLMFNQTLVPQVLIQGTTMYCAVFFLPSAFIWHLGSGESVSCRLMFQHTRSRTENVPTKKKKDHSFV